MDMDRRGATLVAFCLLLVPFMFLASLFLDMGKVYAFRSEAQLAADAAALAGVSGLIGDDQGSGLVTARVHQYVDQNLVGDTHAQVDSLLIDLDAGTLRLVLGYETGPLMLAPTGIRLQAQAGAEVSDETLVSPEGALTEVKKPRLTQ